MYSFAEKILTDHSRTARTRGQELTVSCPFSENHNHGDTNPSFRFNINTGLWVCYGINCQRRGNIYSLYGALRERGWVSPAERIQFTTESASVQSIIKKEEPWVPTSAERRIFNTCVDYFVAAYDADETPRKYIQEERKLIEECSRELGIRLGWCPTREFTKQLFGPYECSVLNKYGITFDDGSCAFANYVLFIPETSLGWIQGRSIYKSTLARFMNTKTPKPVLGLPVPAEGKLILVESIINGITAYQEFGVWPVILNGATDLQSVVLQLKSRIHKGDVYNGLDKDAVKMAWVSATEKPTYDKLLSIEYGDASDINEAHIKGLLGLKAG